MDKKIITKDLYLGELVYLDEVQSPDGYFTIEIKSFPNRKFTLAYRISNDDMLTEYCDYFTKTIYKTRFSSYESDKPIVFKPLKSINNCDVITEEAARELLDENKPKVLTRNKDN